MDYGKGMDAPCGFELSQMQTLFLVRIDILLLKPGLPIENTGRKIVLRMRRSRNSLPFKLILSLLQDACHYGDTLRLFR